LYLVWGAFVALLGGLVSGLFAAIFGLIDYTTIRADHRAKKTATRHMIFNVTALALFGVSAALRSTALDAIRAGLLPFALSAIGVALLAYGGFLGGHLVYSDGIAVGRHRRQTPLPRSTITIVATEQLFIPVADAHLLGEGETLRVDINGTILVIARVGAEAYAFQEYCTHRYGPLSEGALKNCEVICPWHGSRFDLRTGKVTAGPAKVDLHTFRTEIRDGKIWVEAPK
jgi:nitrite reductase/ring-hydroxylating ferredoxin subunit